MFRKITYDLWWQIPVLLASDARKMFTGTTCESTVCDRRFSLADGGVLVQNPSGLSTRIRRLLCDPAVDSWEHRESRYIARCWGSQRASSPTSPEIQSTWHRCCRARWEDYGLVRPWTRIRPDVYERFEEEDSPPSHQRSATTTLALQRQHRSVELALLALGCDQDFRRWLSSLR